MPLVKCEHCGKEFNKIPALIKRVKRHFCSIRCRQEGSKKPNIIEVLGDTANIHCFGGVLIIDAEDVEKVKTRHWNIAKGYGHCSKDKLFIHRLIMDCPVGLVVDHINHNPLDNRKSNLRNCTHTENMGNLSKRKDNKSGETGVFWNKYENKWLSYIGTDSKLIKLGTYDTKQEAIRARKEAELEYRGVRK